MLASRRGGCYSKETKETGLLVDGVVTIFFYSMTDNGQLIISDISEKAKKDLQTSIERKKKKLGKLQAKVDNLSKELQTIREEYEKRIGSLYVKDNELDIEIIKLKNIAKLIKEGLTYDEAEKELEGFTKEFFEEISSKQKEFYTDLNAQEPPSHTDEENISIKKLWKKLLLQFHPDLILNKKEKLKREEIVKKINHAYKKNDYESLRMLQSKWYVDEFKPNTVEQLEYVLVEIENLIIKLEANFRSLRNSQWYVWKIQKTKKLEFDLFEDLEKSLLDDIISKTKILNALKNEIGISSPN